MSNDRYILGPRVFGRVLLSMMPLDAAARLMRAIAFGLLGMLGALALWQFKRARSDATRLMSGGYAVIAVLLALCYGVHYFDATLYFAPDRFVMTSGVGVPLIVNRNSPLQPPPKPVCQ